MAAFYSGGRAFGRLSSDEFCRILKLEEFADISVRDIPRRRIPSGDRTASDLQVGDHTPYDSFLGIRNPFEELSIGRGPTVGSSESYKDQRILRELEISKNCRFQGTFESFDVSLVNGRLDIWAVQIAGRLTRDGDIRVLWPLVVLFPPDYPFSCPTFRYAAVPRLRNVYPTGRVVCSALKKYNYQVNVATLLIEIRGLFDADDEEELPPEVEKGVPEWTVERVNEDHFQGRSAPQWPKPKKEGDEAEVAKLDPARSCELVVSGDEARFLQ
jgi:ubiquitin-protein ligase